MKKICILTATRAEYGLLKPIIKKLIKIHNVKVNVVVTGAHLSQEFGFTYREIEKDAIEIDEKIEILLGSDSNASISKSMGIAMISFADYFKRNAPDLLLVLGDRYETLAVVIAAMNEKIPVAHLYGGETTEGAIDEAIRHAITKMSYLHFTSIDEYRNRVIQLGEDPKRVFTVGAMGIENSLNEELMSKSELEESLEFSLDKPYAIVTFHPTTLENSTSEAQIDELLRACRKRNDIKFIFTKANADADGRIINSKLDLYAKEDSNTLVVDSLGVQRYLSALKYASFVMGNSSSGIIEAPSFGIPTINIGDRQKGRAQANSVINCIAKVDCILEAIEIATSKEFKLISSNVKNPYGDGKTSDKIVSKIYDFLVNDDLEIKKKFFDIEFKEKL